MVEKLVTSFLDKGIYPNQIGIITPYEGQRSYVVQTMIKSAGGRQDIYKEV